MISGSQMAAEAEEGADMYFYSQENAASVYKFGLASKIWGIYRIIIYLSIFIIVFLLAPD